MNDVRCAKCLPVIDPIYPPCDCERVSRTPESAGSNFHSMSEDAQSVAKGMIQFCIENCLAMGMDEGFESFDPDIKHGFRVELEAFCGMDSNQLLGAD